SAAGSRRQPVADACVDAFPVGQGFLGDFEGGFGATGSRGRYEITGLVPGKYDVFVGDENCTTDPDGLVPQWYLGASRMSKATAVTVAAGRTTKSISVTLQRDGSISGTVTGPKPASRPLAGICVQVVPVARGATPFLAETKAPNGGYQTGPLPPGKYRVEFESGCGATGYAAQWWHGAASMKAATPVTVRAGRRHLDISATMTRAAG
ncbi:MAG TPA: carboxypeptidase-like regulatory domain-containing protein, partial [Streptosporangiaceae bacterium]